MVYFLLLRRRLSSSVVFLPQLPHLPITIEFFVFLWRALIDVGCMRAFAKLGDGIVRQVEL